MTSTTKPVALVFQGPEAEVLVYDANDFPVQFVRGEPAEIDDVTAKALLADKTDRFVKSTSKTPDTKD